MAEVGSESSVFVEFVTSLVRESFDPSLSWRYVTINFSKPHSKIKQMSIVQREEKLASLGGVHKRRPQLGGGEGVEECVTECDNRGRGCIGQWEVQKFLNIICPKGLQNVTILVFV
jgi:hypothetical protein